ncbi:NAD(P)H-hydrate epimerase [Microbacterium hominis]|uniref:NAD(P)H-hydrate epimerase n=1 Tax=Microbacterium hominis TaxID=162426 RepID=A0A7D4PUE5_9MICO|nr:NAD(P)H-hydrate epimerase [Microbacterium hominis]QKJ19693.1 NAD(P)H-hydrate epimerase [Microbacterium hominis]
MSVTVPTYTAAQVRAAEQPLLEAGEPLMRRAAAALARIVREERTTGDRRVLVLAGSGDNGGDALLAAADLADAEDLVIDVLPVGTRVHEAALGAAVAAGARLIDVSEIAAGHGADGSMDAAPDVVLDGVLGLGGSGARALRGTAAAAVSALLPAVAAGRTRVIAVDLPSGLDPDAGAMAGAILPATLTVTFGGVKAGLVTGRGPEFAGEVVLVDIGLGAGLAAAEPAGEASISRVVSG